ncbi:MAG: D-sedoheptulose-7-phosphate isomerase [Egibacteraceae bacterium]
MDIDSNAPRAIAADYLGQLSRLLELLDLDAVEAAVTCLRRARDAGATIYIAGNGGSAATATHLVNDLGKATKRSGQRPLRVMCLSDNASWLTALGNDEGYERVFTGQLENFAAPGDVLIVISASGCSPNLIDVVAYAAAHGLETMGLLGFDGGVLKDRVDHLLWLPSEIGAYGLVESGHSVIADILTSCLIADRVEMVMASAG